MQQDDHDAPLTLMELLPPGWTAPPSVVTNCVQQTLQEAVRIAHQALDKPSEKAVMQLFQTMIDRIAFPSGCQQRESMAVH